MSRRCGHPGEANTHILHWLAFIQLISAEQCGNAYHIHSAVLLHQLKGALLSHSFPGAQITRIILVIVSKHVPFDPTQVHTHLNRQFLSTNPQMYLNCMDQKQVGVQAGHLLKLPNQILFHLPAKLPRAQLLSNNQKLAFKVSGRLRDTKLSSSPHPGLP